MERVARMYRCPRAETSPSLSRIGHLVRTVFDEHAIEAYPWALTAVAAMRFGGNQMCTSSSCKHGDHDVDFLLAARNRHVRSSNFSAAFEALVASLRAEFPLVIDMARCEDYIGRNCVPGRPHPFIFVLTTSWVAPWGALGARNLLSHTNGALISAVLSSGLVQV